MLIEQNESVASNRRVPFRLFTSNGTAPDTGASNDSMILGVNSLVTIVPNALVVAINANNGMYCVTLNQSDVSFVGIHPLYHTQGDFCQHVANIEVVKSNPYSTTSAFTSADSVGLKAVTHSGATIAGILDYSLLSGVKSNFSVRLDATAIPAGAFQADSIDATAFAAMNLSDVTVRVHPMQYSGLTISGILDYSLLSGTKSNLTVQAVNVSLSAAERLIISDTSLTEPAAVPAWPMKQRDGLAWLMALSSNSLSQSSVLQTLLNRAGDTSIATAPTSSSSTFFVRGSFA